MTSFSFPRLLAPIEPSHFLQQHWEREPLLVQRHDPAYFSDLFSSGELEQVLQHARLGTGDVRVVREQVELSPTRYLQPDGSIHMNQLYKAYAEGHTLVVNSLQRFVPRLHRLARELQEMLCFGVEFNVYLTPPRSTGLHPHYDTHDVFVLQIEGGKRWNLWGAAEESPLLHSFQPVIPVDALPGAERVVELSAGDLLYLPRGHVHDASTQEAHSMHITIGVYPTQWLDLAQAALTNLALRDAQWRKALPIGWLNRETARAEVQDRLRTLLGALSQPDALDSLAESMTEQLIRASTPLADDQFSSIHAAHAIGPHTLLARRDHLRCRVTQVGDDVRIHFAGNVIKASPEYRSALVQVAQCEAPLRVDALTGLDAGRQVLLAQRLVRGGLMRIAGGAAHP